MRKRGRTEAPNAFVVPPVSSGPTLRPSEFPPPSDTMPQQQPADGAQVEKTTAATPGPSKVERAALQNSNPSDRAPSASQRTASAPFQAAPSGIPARPPSLFPTKHSQSAATSSSSPVPSNASTGHGAPPPHASPSQTAGTALVPTLEAAMRVATANRRQRLLTMLRLTDSIIHAFGGASTLSVHPPSPNGSVTPPSSPRVITSSGGGFFGSASPLTMAGGSAGGARASAAGPGGNLFPSLPSGAADSGGKRGSGAISEGAFPSAPPAAESSPVDPSGGSGLRSGRVGAAPPKPHQLSTEKKAEYFQNLCHSALACLGDATVLLQHPYPGGHTASPMHPSSPIGHGGNHAFPSPGGSRPCFTPPASPRHLAGSPARLFPSVPMLPASFAASSPVGHGPAGSTADGMGSPTESNTTSALDFPSSAAVGQTQSGAGGRPLLSANAAAPPSVVVSPTDLLRWITGLVSKATGESSRRLEFIANRCLATYQTELQSCDGGSTGGGSSFGRAWGGGGQDSGTVSAAGGLRSSTQSSMGGSTSHAAGGGGPAASAHRSTVYAKSMMAPTHLSGGGGLMMAARRGGGPLESSSRSVFDSSLLTYLANSNTTSESAAAVRAEGAIAAPTSQQQYQNAMAERQKETYMPWLMPPPLSDCVFLDRVALLSEAEARAGQALHGAAPSQATSVAPPLLLKSPRHHSSAAVPGTPPPAIPFRDPSLLSSSSSPPSSGSLPETLAPIGRRSPLAAGAIGGVQTKGGRASSTMPSVLDVCRSTVPSGGVVDVGCSTAGSDLMPPAAATAPPPGSLLLQHPTLRLWHQRCAELQLNALHALPTPSAATCRSDSTSASLTPPPSSTKDGKAETTTASVHQGPARSTQALPPRRPPAVFFPHSKATEANASVPKSVVLQMLHGGVIQVTC